MQQMKLIFTTRLCNHMFQLEKHDMFHKVENYTVIAFIS